MALPVGIVANPASGKDVRRLAAQASVFDNREKHAIIRRALIGARALGAEEFWYLDDSHGITREAARELGIKARAVDVRAESSARDTERAARAMADIGCAAVLTLGGDGTNRAFVKGWRSACLLPLSTGTNNVFPVLAEATVAGAALGAIACGAVASDEAAPLSKIVDIETDAVQDVALIDAVLTTQQFVGARALLDGDALRVGLVTRADPACVGMAALGGVLEIVDERAAHGLFFRLHPQTRGRGRQRGRDPAGVIRVRFPLAPGLFTEVQVAEVRKVGLGEAVSMEGPGVIALDGERELVLKRGSSATLCVSRSGPRVVDVQQVLALAAKRGAYRVNVGGNDAK